MKNTSFFQVILIASFVFLAFFGLLLFGNYKGSSAGANVPVAVIWGTIPKSQFNAMAAAYKDDPTFKVQYEENLSSGIETDLVNALASGRGPDLVLLPQDSIYSQRDRIYQIPLSEIPEQTFRDTFIDEATLYLFSDGFLALPISIDPLLVYWNRDIFNSASVASPPSSWEEFINLVPQLVIKDTNGDITQSAVALGNYANVKNSKEILSAMLFQAGVPIVSNSSFGSVRADLSRASDDEDLVGVSVLNFYTQFADPQSPAYSWNRGLPQSQSAFLAGNLAIYFGFSSELPSLRLKNPNLNFDVAAFPQLKNSAKKITFGRMVGASVLKTSGDIENSIRIAKMLSAAPAISALNKVSGLPAVRRDLLNASSGDRYASIFNSAALQSRAWLDPNRLQTDFIFRDMVESIISGSMRVNGAIGTAEEKMNVFFR